MAQLVHAVRELRQEPSLPEQLAAIGIELSEEDQQHLLRGAMRLRNSRHRPGNSSPGAGG
jgi:hypothetical protein